MREEPPETPTKIFSRNKIYENKFLEEKIIC